MGTHINYSGLIIAGIGFFLTRFTVSIAIYDDPFRFYLAGVIPLALGLGLAAFGVALAVADVDATLVRTTALWCVIGAGTMLVLVVLTVVGSTDGMNGIAAERSQTYLSNFLIGGSVGGTLTGLYAARTQRQRRELQRQSNRLSILNRLLRHEILNAVTIIRGYARETSSRNPMAKTVIEDRSIAIERTIEEVKFLTRRVAQEQTYAIPIDINEYLNESVDEVLDRYPDANISITPAPENTMVRANERLSQVVTQLLENAINHAMDDAPTVTVTATKNSVRIRVTDDGPGLPESQRSLLETGDIEKYDNPATGFGLNIVRFLVEGYGGDIETDVGESGTTITVVLPRVVSEVTELRPSQSDLASVRPAIPHLIVTLVAAIIAGVCYGMVSELLGGSIAGIGVFYGTANTTVGWITHEFHSIVFGFVFVSLVSLAPDRYRNNVSTYVLIGIGWALVLWVIAAGFIAPIWLQLLGIPASIPSFSFTLLVSHLVWGISLGLLTAWGYTYVTPRVTRLVERITDGVNERDSFHHNV